MQKDSSYNCDGHSKLHSKTLIKALNVKKKKNCHLLTKPHPPPNFHTKNSADHDGATLCALLCPRALL